MLITCRPGVDNWLLEVMISQVEEDKHNGAVNSLEMMRQFARQMGDTQLLLTLTRRAIT